MPKKTKIPQVTVPDTPDPQVLAAGPKGDVIEQATYAIRGLAAVLAVAADGIVNQDEPYVPDMFSSGLDEILQQIDRHSADIMRAAGFDTLDEPDAPNGGAR